MFRRKRRSLAIILGCVFLLGAPVFLLVVRLSQTDEPAAVVKIAQQRDFSSLVFRFEDIRGNPIVNQRFLSSERYGRIRGSGSIRTDKDGLYDTGRTESGTRHYLFAWPSFGFAEQTVHFRVGARQSPWVVKFKRSVTVSGIVRQENSHTPLGGTVLTPFRLRPDGEHDDQHLWNELFSDLHPRLVSGYPVTRVSRDGDGAFFFANLPPGTYRIIAEHGPGRASLIVSVDGTKDISDIDFLLAGYPEMRSVSGRVLGPGGEPVRNSLVEILVDTMAPSSRMYGPLRGVPRSVITDREGRFRLFPMSSQYRNYWLTAKAPGPINSETVKVDVSDISVEGLQLTLR